MKVEGEIQRDTHLLATTPEYTFGGHEKRSKGRGGSIFSDRITTRQSICLQTREGGRAGEERGERKEEERQEEGGGGGGGVIERERGGKGGREKEIEEGR